MRKGHECNEEVGAVVGDETEDIFVNNKKIEHFKFFRRIPFLVLIVQKVFEWRIYLMLF